jgi:adenosylcobinamide-GDP ribazoletransferase
MKSAARIFVSAVQFLTRLPVPAGDFHQEDLAKSLVFFPVVGLILAAGGVLLRFGLSAHLGNAVVVLSILVYLVLVTGALHEDALADAADGFGGGWDKEQILMIMHDSRIGSYGAIAIVFSLLGRFVLLTEIPQAKFAAYFIAGQVLSRWTPLPLSFFLLPARVDAGQGSRVAQKVSWLTLIIGTVLAGGIAAFFLKGAIWWVASAAVFVTAAAGFYFQKRLGGITGDCLGATIQLAEIGVYLTEVIVRG